MSRALLEEAGVEAVAPPCVDGWSPHPVMQRFAAFDHFLSQRPGVRGVLITDVRDVVFQAPPFEPSPTRLQVFVEADQPLGRHAFNMKYLTALAGADVARQLAAAPCLCVGTVMGPREAMMRFCRLVLTLAATPRSEIGGAFGADQAACNLAAHLGLMEMDVVPNYGRVATLGLTPADGLASSTAASSIRTGRAARSCISTTAIPPCCRRSMRAGARAIRRGGASARAPRATV